MSYAMQAFCSGYIGLTTVGYLGVGTLSPKLVAFCIFALALARLCAVSWNSFLSWVKKCGWKRSKLHETLPLTLREISLLALGGCMRGTLCCALIVRSVPPAHDQNFNDTLLVTNVLTVVVITGLAVGVLLPLSVRLCPLVPEHQRPSRVDPAQVEMAARGSKAAPEPAEAAPDGRRTLVRPERPAGQALLPPEGGPAPESPPKSVWGFFGFSGARCQEEKPLASPKPASPEGRRTLAARPAGSVLAPPAGSVAPQATPRKTVTSGGAPVAPAPPKGTRQSRLGR